MIKFVFEPPRFTPMKGVTHSQDGGWEIPRCKANSLKAKMEEVWNRKGVALTMHHPRWFGSMNGFWKGTVYKMKKGTKLRKRKQLSLF